MCDAHVGHCRAVYVVFADHMCGCRCGVSREHECLDGGGSDFELLDLKERLAAALSAVDSLERIKSDLGAPVVIVADRIRHDCSGSGRDCSGQ
ncbi:hypothetical protein AHF37_00374 [Paragonimus kellicotti]|nr:hypothetical protein AHF37_00374 [Paragonimus kellicotti]